MTSERHVGVSTEGKETKWSGSNRFSSRITVDEVTLKRNHLPSGSSSSSAASWGVRRCPND